jgi:hypothetical protein
MTPEDIKKAIANIPRTGLPNGPLQYVVSEPEMNRIVRLAMREAYLDAAKIAEHLNGWGTKPCPELANHIAAAIRARITPRNTTPADDHSKE